MRYPLPEETFNDWYSLVANGSLAQRAGNTVTQIPYKTQAIDLVGNWVTLLSAKICDLYMRYPCACIYEQKWLLPNYEKMF